jgi:hypothetical protein
MISGTIDGRCHRRKQSQFVHMMCLVIALAALQLASALSSSFHGISIHSITQQQQRHTPKRLATSQLVMRKQKASDRHTARMQRGQTTLEPIEISTQILSSRTFTKNQWKHKKIELRANGVDTNKNNVIGGRGRARKRLKLYNSLEGYHSKFLSWISEEYRMEVSMDAATVYNGTHN